MTSGPNTSFSPPPVTDPRLRLQPTGNGDGTWSPRTHDLAAELPALLAALAARLGRIDRVTYPLADWPDLPRRITVDDRVIRLEGFRSQPSGSLTVVGWDRHHTTLQVVPAETGPGTTGDGPHERTSRSVLPLGTAHVPS